MGTFRGRTKEKESFCISGVQEDWQAKGRSSDRQLRLYGIAKKIFSVTYLHKKCSDMSLFSMLSGPT